MHDLILTETARQRAQRRGLCPSVVETVLDYADLEMPLGGGRIALRLSRRAFFLARDERGATLAERSQNVVLILAGHVLVTVLHAYGLPSRLYRRRGC